jgi:hypothetical protein
MIEGVSIIGLTPAGLLLLAVLMVFTGRLVPRATLRDTQIERDKWRQAYEGERDARAISDAQTRELLEVAKTSRQLLESVYTNSEKIKSGDT